MSSSHSESSDSRSSGRPARPQPGLGLLSRLPYEKGLTRPEVIWSAASHRLHLMLQDMREHNSYPSAHLSMKFLPKLTLSQKSVQQIVSSLVNHRINTLTELCRVERLAASCDNEVDARAFQEPMTTAWIHYVTSHQFLSELRGLTRSYPFSGDVITEAHTRVLIDPESNRSWNLAWLCLMKMRDDELVSAYAAVEASKPEMWGSMEPTEDQVAQLAACFEHEWSEAVTQMLRHWNQSPTWY